ncbi:MAG: phosphatase PAP2 family protein [Actinobacteria bacterium]|nr:phosphatase PAP2 family protein [Actinomycetota bacterium]
MAPRLRSPAAALFGALVCVLLAGATMTAVYVLPGVQRLDAVALHGFNTLEGGPLAGPTLTLAFMSAPLAIVPGLPLLYWAGSHWGRRREALVGVAVVLGSSAIAEVVKVVSAHERFQPVLGPHQVNAASFPSGTVAVVMALVVAALIVVPDRLRVRTAIVGITAVVLVAFSVLVNLWHFPSDVLGGILIPTACGFVGIAALRHMRRPRVERSARLTARRPVGRPSRAMLEAGAAAAFAACVAAVLIAGQRVVHYADHYTTTVFSALAISAVAAALLTLFGLAAADDS